MKYSVLTTDTISEHPILILYTWKKLSVVCMGSTKELLEELSRPEQAGFPITHFLLQPECHPLKQEKLLLAHLKEIKWHIQQFQMCQQAGLVATCCAEHSDLLTVMNL